MVVQSIIPYRIYVHVCRALAQSTEPTKSARLLRTSTELRLQIRLLLPLELLLSELLLNTRLCPVAPVSMLPYAVEDEESKQVLDNAEEKRSSENTFRISPKTDHTDGACQDGRGSPRLI